MVNGRNIVTIEVPNAFVGARVPAATRETKF